MPRHPRQAPQPPSITPAQRALLAVLLRSPLPARITRGQPLVLRDAYDFWGVRADTPADTIRARIVEIREALSAALAAHRGNAGTDLPDHARLLATYTCHVTLTRQFTPRGENTPGA